jgi:hypothetical protein
VTDIREKGREYMKGKIKYTNETIGNVRIFASFLFSPEELTLKDGRTFCLIPEKAAGSPLDVPTIKTAMTTREIVDIIREGRER